MSQSKRKYRWSNLVAAALIVMPTSSAVLAGDGMVGEFRDFCVGSSCNPAPSPWATPIQQSEDLPMSLSFSINFDLVTAPAGTGFTFLEVLDDQGQVLLQIDAVRALQPGESQLALNLTYMIGPPSLYGSLSLGYSVAGADCFWIERTSPALGIPSAPGIRVTRTGSGQEYDTEILHNSDPSTGVRQGALELLGEPSGRVLISDAVIGKKCDP